MANRPLISKGTVFQDDANIPSSTISSLSTSTSTLLEKEAEEVPLRIIHGRGIMFPNTPDQQMIEVLESRANFWEAYAKQVLALYRSMGNSNPRIGQKSEKGLYQKRYEDMSTEIQHLMENLDVLKSNQKLEERKILKLQEELRRAEKVKNGYKKQVNDLTTLLEDTKYTTSSQSSGDERSRDEIILLQNKITTMRLQIEGYKTQIDQERVERSLIQGTLNDLQDRYKRREISLDMAQKRCRKLEAQLRKEKARREKVAVHGDLEDKRGDQGENEPHTVDGAPSAIFLTTDEQADTTESMQSEYIDPQSDDTRISPLVEHVALEEQLPDQVHEQVSENGIDSKHETRTDEVPEQQETQRGVVERNHDVGENLETVTEDNHYSRIFGDMDLFHAEQIIVTADETLCQCILKMQSLSRMLQSSNEELDNLKGTCARQYEQIFQYRNTCTSLKAKLSDLQNHVIIIKQASTDYQAQMEHVVELQRKAAAEESHNLASELQHMSQEQARLLLKLHAAELDLDKSKSICRQLMRRVHTLEQSQDQVAAEQQENLDIPSRMPSPSIHSQNGIISVHVGQRSEENASRANIVSKLQHIAQGLRGLSIPRSGSVSEPMLA